MITIVNYFTLSYAIFSIIYQSLIIKKWCPLCLLIQLVFISEFFILFYIPNENIFFIDKYVLIYILSSFLIPLFIWKTIKPIYIQSIKSEFLEKKILTFKTNTAFLKGSIEVGKIINTTDIDNDLYISKAEGGNELIVVTNPLCKPCEALHKNLIPFINYFDGLVSVKILPLPDQEVNSIRSKVSQKILDFFDHTSDIEMRNKFINDYFSIKNKNEATVSKWVSSHNIDTTKDSKKLERILYWATNNKILFTPTLILNNKVIDQNIRLNDIKRYLKIEINQ